MAMKCRANRIKEACVRIAAAKVQSRLKTHIESYVIHARVVGIHIYVTVTKFHANRIKGAVVRIVEVVATQI